MDVDEHEWLSNITLIQIKVKEHFVVRKDIDVNEHEWLSNITLIYKLNKGTFCSTKGYWCRWTRVTIQHYTYIQNQVKEHFVVRKDIDVDEHEWLSNITLIYKLK
jgi:uncharacterized membrane protein